MTRERTHRRRRGRACPRTVWRTPRRTQRRTRGPRCARGARDRGCVTAAPRLPRRRTEPGVHMPRVLGAPPHTAHGPGSRLDCRTGGTIARWLRGVGGWLGRALRRSSHRTASGGARAARAGLRGAVEEHAARPQGARAGLTRACLRGRARAARAGLRGGQWEARDVRPPPPPST